jgi:dihydrofolate synthase/folylpolyglutamate synthase
MIFMKNYLKAFLLQDWLNYRLVLHQCSHQYGLERLYPIAKQYQLTHFDCPVITVTGTNGKGSCVKLLEDIYTRQGYRVGAYTSPHCDRFNERISVLGQPISDEKIIEAFKKIDAACTLTGVTFFEFITLAALYIFKQSQLDILLLEVGIGGMLDPVNLIDANLVLLTTIGLDHTDLLGASRDNIARAKAGLFRHCQPVVCGELIPPPYIFEYTKKLSSPLFWIHRDFEYAYNLDQRLWHWQMQNVEYRDLPIPSIKLQNAACVLAVIQTLQPILIVASEAIIRSLANIQMPSRFERRQHPCPCILDAAHNPQAAQWLARQLMQLNIKGRIFAVFGMLTGKDIANVIKPLKPLVAGWYVAPILGGYTRASAHQQIMTVLKQEGIENSQLLSCVEEAFDAAVAALSDNDYVLIFGSFHTVTHVKNLLRSQA